MPPQHNFATKVVLGCHNRFASITTGPNAQIAAIPVLAGDSSSRTHSSRSRVGRGAGGERRIAAIGATVRLRQKRKSASVIDVKEEYTRCGSSPTDRRTQLRRNQPSPHNGGGCHDN
jgi:hypothetical protein